MSADPDEHGDAIFKALSIQLSQRLSVVDPVVGPVVARLSIIVASFDASMVLLDASGADMLKADHGAIPPDARWITVHPNGAGSKGQPVLIVPAGKDGAYRVMGGAGGKLNMLKLRGVKSEGSYKEEAAARSAASRQKRKDMIVADKAAGVHEAKEKARADILDARRKAQAAFVKTVASALNWDASALTLDTSELSPEASDPRLRHEANSTTSGAGKSPTNQLAPSEADGRSGMMPCRVSDELPERLSAGV